MRKLFLIALLLTATFASAQLPPGKWWQRPEVVRELSLTNEQRDRLDGVFRAAANDLIDAKASVEKLQIALKAEIDRPQLRRAEALRIAAQLGEARGKLFERETMMLLDMRAVLTEEQWTRMRDRLEQMRERARERPMMRPQGQGRRQQ